MNVFEAAELVGGAAAYSGGQVWGGDNHVARREGIDDDTLELAERYVRAIAHSHPEVLDEKALLRWLATSPDAIRYWEDVGAIRWTVIPGLADYHNEADGALPEGRYLTNEVDRRQPILGEWRDKLRVQPLLPGRHDVRRDVRQGPAADLRRRERRRASPGRRAGVRAARAGRDGASRACRTDDPLTFGTGVVAQLPRPGAAGAVDRPCTSSTRSPSSSPTSAARWSGVRAAEPGRAGGAARAGGARDQHLRLGPRAGPGARRAGARRTGAASRRDTHPRRRHPAGARGRRRDRAAPRHRDPDAAGLDEPTIGVGYAYGPDYAMPHAMIVDRTGRRYCDDSYWVDIVAKTMDPDDPHLPFYLVFDEQHHQKYGLGATPPGGDYPAGLVDLGARPCSELGDALGIDGEQLEKTAATFSEQRPAGRGPRLGPRHASTYVKRFAGDPANEPEPGARARRRRRRSTASGCGSSAPAIGTSGVHIDGDGHVLDEAGAAASTGCTPSARAPR